MGLIHKFRKAQNADGNTILLREIQGKNWNQVIARLYTHPLEARIATKVHLKNTNPRRAESLDVSSQTIGSERRDDENVNVERVMAEENEGKDAREAKCRVLPLPVALIHGAPLTVVKALLRAYPQSIGSRDSRYNRYPIHFACLYHPRLEVIDALILLDGSSVLHRDTLVRTPLHYAAFGNAPIEVFERLLEVYPQAAKVQDGMQWLPLHVASRTACEFEVLRILIEAHPSGLQAKTRRGSTAVQIARYFFGAGSALETQLCTLQAAVEAIYDTTNERLSLNLVSYPMRLYENRSSSETVNLGNAQGDEIVENSKESSKLPNLRASECSSIDYEDMNSLLQTVVATELNVDQACVVCMEGKRTHAFVPCGHMCVCEDCTVSTHLHAGGIKCPLCRKKSFLVMKVFA